MPGGAVPVAPPSIGGQQLTQQGEQVGVTACPGLDHREARGGMRHPHVQQPIADARFLEERAALRGEVTHLLARPGLDAEFPGVHPKTVAADRYEAHTTRPLPFGAE